MGVGVRLVLSVLCGAVAAVLLAGAATRAQPAPPARDPVEALKERLASGALQLEHRPDKGGYLPALLKALDVPVDSQVLVFSKTSLQAPAIGPATPRAIYFNDEVTVGEVPGGQLIEIISVDADGRIAFHTLATAPSPTPRFEVEGMLCVACHGAVNRWAPGMIVADVIPQEDGAPLFVTIERLFNLTDSTTPFEHRWGGWYVSGRTGPMRHNGNVRAAPETPSTLDPQAGLNHTDLSSFFDSRPYLAANSDVVALMTLEHQVGALNRIWKLQAQADPASTVAERQPTPEELDDAVEDLATYLVGAHEAPLPGPVEGVSSFTRTFPARAPKDGRGRGLKDFDLETRLFRYPLSYMIYSRAFDAIAPSVRERVYRRLYAILGGADASPAFAALPAERRRAAIEILAATKPGLPDFWKVPAI